MDSHDPALHEIWLHVKLIQLQLLLGKRSVANHARGNTLLEVDHHLSHSLQGIEDLLVYIHTLQKELYENDQLPFTNRDGEYLSQP